MANFKLSNTAKEDLIRIHHYGIERFGEAQANKYLYTFFDYFEIIATRPLSFEPVDYYWLLNAAYVELLILMPINWKLRKFMNQIINVNMWVVESWSIWKRDAIY